MLETLQGLDWTLYAGIAVGVLLALQPVAALTPTEADNKVLNFLLKGLDLIAGNKKKDSE